MRSTFLDQVGLIGNWKCQLFIEIEHTNMLNIAMCIASTKYVQLSLKFCSTDLFSHISPLNYIGFNLFPRWQRRSVHRNEPTELPGGRFLGSQGHQGLDPGQVWQNLIL